MEFNFDETTATETAGSGGKKVLDTGVYAMTVDTIYEATASTGTTGFDLRLQIDGSKYPNNIFGMWTTKSNGDAITFNASKIQNLMGLTGKKYTTFKKEIETHAGKKKVNAVKEFEGFKGYAAIVKVLSYYNGAVSEKNELVQFLSADKKTYAEVSKNGDAKQFDYYSANLKDTKTDEYKKWEADGGDTETEEVGSEEEGESIL